MRNNTKKHADKHQQDPEVDGLIQRLETATQRLNAAARQATRRIEALEERLVAAEPGIELWGPVLLSELTSFQSDNGETTEGARRVFTLGYAKVKKDRWGFAVREVVKAPGGAVLADTTRLLHKAERNLRLVALPQLTVLTRQIVEALEAQTVGLEDLSDDEADNEAEHSSEHPSHADN